MKLSYNWKLMTLLCLIFIFSGCKNPKEQHQPVPVPEVKTITVSPTRLILKTELPGRTVPYRISEIRPRVNGLIKRRLFKEGSYVKQVELLYEIDPEPFRAELKRAMATLESSKKNLLRARVSLSASLHNLERQKAILELSRKNARRLSSAYKDRAVSETQLDEALTDARVQEANFRTYEAQVERNKREVELAESEVKRAEALLEIAKINLGYTTIKAPISGRIGKSNVNEGAIVTAYQPMPLATIQQIDPIYVDVPQSTTELLLLKKRLGKYQKIEAPIKVKLILEDGSLYELEGTLKFRDVTVDPTTGSVTLRTVFPNPAQLLLPGMFVRVIIPEGIDEQAIMIPQQTVLRNHKWNPFVFVVNEKEMVEARPVELDRAIEDKWLVSRGLKKGDRIILEGLQFIRPGTPVKAVNSSNAQKNPTGDN